jgi:hypothetical protein
MKPPVRLGAAGSNAAPELREVLRHARRYEPQAERVAALTAAVLAELQPSAAPALGKGGLSLSGAKVVGLCGAAALSIGVGWSLLSGSQPDAARPAPAQALQSAETGSRGAGERKGVENVPAPEALPHPKLSAAEPAPPRPVRAAKARAPITSAAPTEDPSLLQTARRLRRQDPSAALQALEAHTQRYPKSTLREERDALRIEIMRQLDPRAAAALSVRFERDFPGSVYGGLRGH